MHTTDLINELADLARFSAGNVSSGRGAAKRLTSFGVVQCDAHRRLVYAAARYRYRTTLRWRLDGKAVPRQTIVNKLNEAAPCTTTK